MDAEEDAGWQRLDKFLFHARFARTRAAAGRLIAGGHVRLNRQLTGKPHAKLRIGDVLTIALPPGVRVVRVAAIASRRGPATEARELYEEIVEWGGRGENAVRPAPGSELPSFASEVPES